MKKEEIQLLAEWLLESVIEENEGKLSPHVIEQEFARLGRIALQQYMDEGRVELDDKLKLTSVRHDV